MAGASDIRAGRAYVELLLKDAALRKGLSGLKGMIGNFVSGFGIAAGIASWGQLRGAISGAITSFAEGGDRIGKMSKRTGVGVAALSELGFAAEQSGQDIGVLETTLKKMEKTIGGAFMGAGESAKSLHMLGIGLDQLKGKSPDQQFEIISEAMSKIQDPARRAKLAMEIFGRSGTDLLPLMMKGAAGIRALRQEARDLGLSKSPEDVKLAEELTEAYNRLGRVKSSIFSKIGAAVAPAVLQSVNYVTRIGVATGKWIKENRELIGTVGRIGALVVATATGVGALGLALALAAKAAAGLGVLGAIFGAIVSPVGLITAALAGGAYAWVTYSESGQAAYASIKEVLGTLLDTAKETFGGISDALQGGNLALAGKIGILGLKVAMLQGLAAIADAVGGQFGDLIGKLGTQILGGDLTGAWETAIGGMASIWADFSKGIVSVFSEAVKTIIGLWKSATTGIANYLLKDAAEGGIMGMAALMGTGIDMKTEEGKRKAMRMQDRMLKQRDLEHEQGNLDQANANGGSMTDQNGNTWTSGEIQRRIDELKQQLGELSGAGSSFLEDSQKAAEQQIAGQADALTGSIGGALDAVQAQADENARKAKEKLDQITGAPGEGASGAHAGASAAQAELDQLTAEARDLAEAQKKKEKDRDDAAKDAAEGGSGAELGKEVLGSFSAAALAAGGATSSPMERIAEAAEKQNVLIEEQTTVIEEGFNGKGMEGLFNNPNSGVFE